MAGKIYSFPVVCVVLSVAQQLNAFMPPFIPHIRPMRRFGFPPNEIMGSGPPFRPPPGVLIAGQGPPGIRPIGPMHHGGRPVQFLPSSSSPATLTAWPLSGAQIQRAKEASHFEYEVVAPPTNLPKPPPTMLRPVSRFSGHPNFLTSTQHPATVPQEMMRVIAQESYPFPRTEAPPTFVTTQPSANPTFATPSDADFQEGFRILSDLFREQAGSNIRQNLVGGSEVSFNGGYLPTPTSPARRNATEPPKNPEIQVLPAAEKPVIIAAGTPEITPSNSQKNQSKPAPVYPRPTEKPAPSAPEKMEESESSYLEMMPHFPPGPSHVSYMYTDPNEGPHNGAYNLYDDSPPPPFNIGNSIIPPPPTPSPPQGQNPNARPPSQNQPQQPQVQSAPQNYNNGPPGKVIRNELPQFPPNNGQRPLMVVPVGAVPKPQNSNEPAPSSDEVQKALTVLARYASKQAHQMGVNISPQMILQQEIPDVRFTPPPPHSNPTGRYGPPTSSSPPPNGRYGPPSPPPPPPRTSSARPTFLPPTPTTTTTTTTTAGSVSYRAPILISAPYSSTTTTEANNAITISSGQTEESSPFPQYGPPQTSDSNGGWSSGGGSGGGSGAGIIGAKVKALETIGSAVTGGLKSITGLKAGIFNAGLSAIGNLSRAKGDIANSLKIPIVSKKPWKTVYGAPTQPVPSYGPPEPEYSSSPPQPPPTYGPPTHAHPEAEDGPIVSLVNGVKDVVGGISGTIAKTGKAAVGIGLSKNEFVRNHFAIKGQAFTDVVSKNVANKNDYFQNVIKHIQSIFEASTKRPNGGWSAGWN